MDVKPLMTRGDGGAVFVADVEEWLPLSAVGNGTCGDDRDDVEGEGED